MKPKGFTLIELMIVIAIIAVLAAILIPHLMRGKQSADEKAVISTMKSFATMQALFSGDKARFGTVQELEDGEYLHLGATITNGLPGDDLLEFDKAGYHFVFSRPGEQEWSLTAVPLLWNRTGTVNYHIDQGNVVRFNEVGGQVPTANDQVLK